MDLFLTEEDYLPAEFDELPLDEAILRVREIEEEEERSSKKKKSKDGKEKRKRPRDEEEEDRSDEPDDQYSDEDDGWLVNDLGDDGYIDEDDEDEDRVVDVKDGVKVFGADEAEEDDNPEGGEGGVKNKKKKKDEKEKEKKPRRRINATSRVVLNVDRLKNVNALAALPEIQRKLHFKGKGHEEEDLDRIMQTMEHWAHRVMPSMKFDDFIEKSEQLGSKKILKAFISKIRYGLSLDTNGDIPGIDFEAMDHDDDFAFDDDLPPMPPINAEDAFDAIMREAEEVVKQRAAAAAATSATNSPSVSGLQSTLTNLSLDKTITPMKSSPQTMSSQSTTPVINKTPSLTEEQRRKIAENARKAAEKRLSLQMARSQPIPTDSQPNPTDSQPIPTDSQPIPTDSQPITAAQDDYF